MERALTRSLSPLSASATLDRPKSDIARIALHVFKFRERPQKSLVVRARNSRKRWSLLLNLRSSAASSASESQGNADMAVVLEVEGVLADVHKFGHRRSFNSAFQEFNLECANWSEPVYADLLRRAGGVEETMLQAFFDGIGWPSSLPTSEKDLFVRNIMKSKRQELKKVAASGDLPLRPGIPDVLVCCRPFVDSPAHSPLLSVLFTLIQHIHSRVSYNKDWRFIDEVLQAQVPLLVLSAYNKIGEEVVRSLIAQLGPERAKRIEVVSEADVESSAYGQVVLGAGAQAGLDEQLAQAAAQAVAAEKQRVAEEVASMLALSVEVDTNFNQSSRKAIAALRAAAEIAEVNMNKCVLLAGSQTGAQAAFRIGMPCVVVRSSTTARAEFPMARAALDGFGPGSVTLSRLQKFL